MARFLLTVWPFDTHISPNMALAHGLRRRGHEVAFHTAEDYRALVEKEGFRLFPFQKVDGRRVRNLLQSLIVEWARPWRTRKLWRQFLLDTVPAQLEDLEPILHAWPPDIIVSDLAMWGPLLVLREKISTPVAVLAHVGYCMLPGRDGGHPGVTLRLRNDWLNRSYARAASRMIELGTTEIRKTASKLRAGHGLPPLDAAAVDYTGRVPLYLVPSVPEFDGRRNELPPSVRYIGSCLWEEPDRAGLPANMREHGPSVLIIGGTLHVSEPWFLEAAKQALASLPVTVHAPDPRNVLQWIRSADVVVTQGSTEIVVPALTCGVPLVVVPSVLEEPQMAHRVADNGAGINLPRRRCTPERLRAAVEQVLGNPSFRQNAQRMAQAFKDYEGPDLAAGLLEELLQS